MTPQGFSFAFDPPTIVQGPTALDQISTQLDSLDVESVFVVTSPTVGETAAVMDPLRESLGDRLAGIFDAVTSEKSLGTARDAAIQAQAAGADAVVGVGGGGSLDVATVVAVLLGYEGDIPANAKEMIESEAVVLPEDPLPELFAIPTTLPGAELSQVAGATFTPEPGAGSKSEAPSGVASDPRLMPSGVCYDHRLYRSTPPRILARSAMNGFDKGIEMLYSRDHTPITDATAVRGLRLLARSLPRITRGELTDAVLSDILGGIVLVQYGLSSPDTYRASIIHAFGHALTGRYPIQQGEAHAIAAPYVLSYLFEHVDARRDLLAEAFGVGSGSDLTAEETAAGIVDAVESVRDGLGLPTRLGDIEAADWSDIPDLARAVLDDSFMAGTPDGLDPTQAEIESVFEAMY